MTTTLLLDFELLLVRSILFFLVIDENGTLHKGQRLVTFAHCLIHSKQKLCTQAIDAESLISSRHIAHGSLLSLFFLHYYYYHQD